MYNYEISEISLIYIEDIENFCLRYVFYLNDFSLHLNLHRKRVQRQKKKLKKSIFIIFSCISN